MDTSDRLLAPPRLKAALALAWLICTAFVVTKAVHVDDTAHLAIAEHIREDPLHPMSGTVFWGERPAPIHDLNQPHLFFYLLAGALALSGGSLFAAHLVVALFTALCALFGLRLGRALGLSPRRATLGAALILLGPAFIPGQNLMTDVPMLAFWLAAFDALVRADPDRPRMVYLAGLYVGLACLIKYTSLVLLPILVIDAFVRDRRKAALGVLVPIAMLAAWSAFNFWDYGGVHLFDRPVDSAQVGGPLATIGVVFGRAGLFVLTLGASCPFTLGALAGTMERRGMRRVALSIVFFLLVGLVIGQGLAHFGPREMRGEPVAMSLFRALFVLNGFYTVALVLGARRVLMERGERRDAWLLASWLGLTSLFVIVLSPFVAVRHVLLVVPAVVWLLLCADLLARPGWALGLTAVLGIVVAFGDAQEADAYRQVARRLAEEEGATHYVGHWGFQHYAEEAGLRPYVPGQTVLSPCDVLVRPRNVDQPPILEEDLTRMRAREQLAIEGTLLDVPRTLTSRLGYYAVWQGVPYTFTFEPIDVIDVYEVDPAGCASSRARATDAR